MAVITSEKRDGHIDVISGLMILQMMLSAHVVDWSHMEGSFLYSVLIRVFPFYLPFFFFKSGYLSSLPQDISSYRKKLVKKVLMPFVYFSIIGFIVYTLVNISYGITTLSQVPKSIGVFFYSIFKTGSHGSNIPIWFLLTFFLVRLSHPLFASIIKTLSMQIIISFLFVFAASLFKKYCNSKGIDYPLWINNYFLGMFFYLLGGGIFEIGRLGKAKLYPYFAGYCIDVLIIMVV